MRAVPWRNTVVVDAHLIAVLCLTPVDNLRAFLLASRCSTTAVVCAVVARSLDASKATILTVQSNRYDVMIAVEPVLGGVNG